LVFRGVRQDGATPRQKEGEAKGEEEGGGREKELNEVVVSVHFELSFENIRSFISCDVVADLAKHDCGLCLRVAPQRK
jgi:hypothetical protein